MGFIINERRQKPMFNPLLLRWGKIILIVSAFFLFTLTTDFFLPKEKIEGKVEELKIFETQSSDDVFINIEGESMMLSGIMVSEGDYIWIERTPIFNQIITYKIEYGAGNEWLTDSYYGNYYGVFCFVPLLLFIATVALFFNLKTNDFITPLFFTVLFLLINICMALA